MQITHEWDGLNSSKFGYSERVHYEPRDMLKTLQGSDFPPTGRKHFEPAYGTVMQDKICLRVFPTVHNIQSSLDEPKSLSKLAYVAPPKKLFLKLNGVSPSFFKPPRIKSLVRPQTFNGIRGTRKEIREASGIREGTIPTLSTRRDINTAMGSSRREMNTSIGTARRDISTAIGGARGEINTAIGGTRREINTAIGGTRREISLAMPMTSREEKKTVRIVKMDWKQKDKIQARQSEIDEVANLNYWLPLTVRPVSTRFGMGIESREISSRLQMGSRSLSQKKF